MYYWYQILILLMSFLWFLPTSRRSVKRIGRNRYGCFEWRTDSPRSWLWNKIKWHFRLETLPFSWLEFWLKIPRGSRSFVWESQFTVESGSHNFKFVNWFLMLINSLYKSWPDHCWCNISRTQLHGERGRESEVRCLKNLCTRHCQQGKGAAAVFDVFSSNAKSCYESNMERTRAHDVDEPVLRLA